MKLTITVVAVAVCLSLLFIFLIVFVIYRATKKKTAHKGKKKFTIEIKSGYESD